MKQPHVATKLEAGQVWRLDQGYLYIVDLGKRHVHYKMLNHPHQRAALTRMIRIEPLLRFLQDSEAELTTAPGAADPRTPSELAELLAPWVQRSCASPRERMTLIRAEIPRPPTCVWGRQTPGPRLERPEI